MAFPELRDGNGGKVALTWRRLRTVEEVLKDRPELANIWEPPPLYRVKYGGGGDWNNKGSLKAGVGFDQRRYRLQMKHPEQNATASDAPTTFVEVADRNWNFDEIEALYDRAVEVLTAHNFPIDDGEAYLWAWDEGSAYWAAWPHSHLEDKGGMIIWPDEGLEFFDWPDWQIDAFSNRHFRIFKSDLWPRWSVFELSIISYEYFQSIKNTSNETNVEIIEQTRIKTFEFGQYLTEFRMRMEYPKPLNAGQTLSKKGVETAKARQEKWLPAASAFWRDLLEKKPFTTNAAMVAAWKVHATAQSIHLVKDRQLQKAVAEFRGTAGASLDP